MQPVENRLQRLLHVPLLVGVVDPQNELPAVLPGKEPIEQRSAYAANVQISGRAGSEAGANGHGIVESGEWRVEREFGGSWLWLGSSSRDATRPAG